MQSLAIRNEHFTELNVSNLRDNDTVRLLMANDEKKLKKETIRLKFPSQLLMKRIEIKSMIDPLLVRLEFLDEFEVSLTCVIQYGVPPTDDDYDVKLDISKNGSVITKNTKNGNMTNTTSPSQNPMPATNNGTKRQSFIRLINNHSMIMWNFMNFTYGIIGQKYMYISFRYKGGIPPPILIDNIFTFDILEVQRTVNISMQTLTPSCLFFNNSADKWDGEGVSVSNKLRLL